MKQRTMNAWANVTMKDGIIRENNDDPRFLCVHKTKKEADGARMHDELTVKCTITY